MRDAPGGTDLAGTVGVVGLSKTGEAVARALLGRGVQVRIIEEFYSPETMVEMRQSLEEAGCDVFTGTGPGSGVAAIAGCSLLVTSPGVSAHSQILTAAAANDIEVWSEIELAYRILETKRASGDSSKLVAITGTNGKTTVVSMITEIATADGFKAIACGNIGYPLVDAVTNAVPDTLFVAEVSSFQLHFTRRFKPDIAVLLNFAPDHMDWHADLEEYARAKGKIYLNQTTGDCAVWNAGDGEVRRIAEASMTADVMRVPFVASEVLKGAVCVHGQSIVSPAGEGMISLDALPDRNVPTVENALAACAVMYSLGISSEAIARGIEGFKSPSHRIETVRAAGGIEFVDDSKATNPHASRSAIASFASVVLIAGGYNKGLDLREIHGYGDDSVLGRIKAVVAIGDAAAAVTEAFRDTAIPTSEAVDMVSAVERAVAIAVPGDVVLLSPGCASFDAYSNYAERGDDFKSAVASLLGDSHGTR